MIVRADVTKLPLADQSVDLVFGSPPYCDARTYDDGTLPEGHTVSRNCEDWITWMLEVTTECLRVSKGAVVWVIGSVTRGRDYWAAPEGLLYEWCRNGGSAYRPCFWHRVGIPGSGGDQWFRSDVEYILCFKRSGKLPWTDNTAMGHPPKWNPGGDMSNRTSNGNRVNDPWGKRGRGNNLGGRNLDGSKKLGTASRQHTKAKADGTMEVQNYTVPKIANPGNLVSTGVSGGGRIGDWMAHENEAPFPEKLAEWFVLSLCPKSGITLDPFSGSGTTAKVCRQHHRRFVASDIRTSQCEKVVRRTKNVQTVLF